MSKVESLDIITPDELKWLQEDMAQRIEPEGIDRTMRMDHAYMTWHLAGRNVIDRRVNFRWDDPKGDPAMDLVSRIVRRRLDTDRIFCAYQRQYLPHHVHVDDVTLGSDYVKENNYSLVIPLMEDPSFKTFAWKNEFTSSHDLELYRNNFRLNHQHAVKINNLSEEHWLDHCSCSRRPEFVDCHELDGVYQYRLGTVGMFPRVQMHASNNWLRSKKYTHKDLVIIHVQ